MNRYIGWALLTAFFFGIHLSADQAITITARPAVIPAKGSALLKVIVERNAMNRTLVWEVDGRAYYRSSTMQLEGSSAARSYFFMLRDLPGGTSTSAHECFAATTPRSWITPASSSAEAMN